MATMDIKEQVEVSINGERAALLDLNVRMSETDPKNSLEIKTPPIHIPAGPQRVTAAFIQRFDGPLDDLLIPLENTLADVNISFGVTALLLALAYRSWLLTRDDEVQDDVEDRNVGQDSPDTEVSS